MENPRADDLSDPATTVVKVSTPADVLGVLPHRIGFHPTESLVAISLHGPRCRDELVMRFDLPPRDLEAAFAEEVVGRLVHKGADATLLVCYTDAPRTAGGLPRAPMVRALRRQLRRAGIDVRDALVVSGDRWWSYLCRDEACCPQDGTPVPVELTPAATSFAAEVVARGSAVLEDRGALARSVEALPGAGDGWADFQDVPDAGSADVAGAAIDGLVVRWASGDFRLSDTDVRMVAEGMRSTFSRDYVLTLVLDHPPEVLEAVFLELARRTPDRVGAPVCAALAWFAHGAGNGALAVVAAERALRCQQGYALAELVLESLVAMLPPAVVKEIGAEVRAALFGTDRYEDEEDLWDESWDEAG